MFDVEWTGRCELWDLIESTLLEYLTDLKQHILKRQVLGRRFLIGVHDLEKGTGQCPTGTACEKETVVN